MKKDSTKPLSKVIKIDESEIRGHLDEMVGGVIRFNPWILGKYFEENLRDTLAHEVAPYIVHEVYPRRTTKPHGYHWKNLIAPRAHRRPPSRSIPRSSLRPGPALISCTSPLMSPMTVRKVMGSDWSMNSMAQPLFAGREQVEQAHGHMPSGQHRGKIILKI